MSFAGGLLVEKNFIPKVDNGLKIPTFGFVSLKKFSYQYRSGGILGPEKGLMEGSGCEFFVRAISFNKSILGGARPLRSPRFVTASLTSSTSIV